MNLTAFFDACRNGVMGRPNRFDKPQDKTPLTITIGNVPDYANDAAAAAGGVPVGGVYRNASVLQIRAI